MPIQLPRMPHEYNTLSPTPLDSDALQVHGIAYGPQALNHFHQLLGDAASELDESNASQVERAEAEIAMQHSLRMQKNAEAMEALREEVSGTRKKISHAEAEGILQVRAGIARPQAIIELLARNPGMGGIEIAKATRPFCMVAHTLARTALKKELSGVPGITVEHNPAPYRALIEEENVALVTKTKIATVAMSGLEIEVISRTSGMLYNPEVTPPMPEAFERNFGGMPLHVAPLDLTTYARIK